MCRDPIETKEMNRMRCLKQSKSYKDKQLGVGGPSHSLYSNFDSQQHIPQNAT